MKKMIMFFFVFVVIVAANIYFFQPQLFAPSIPLQEETTTQEETPLSVNKNAPTLEILPTMESSSVAKNQVWAGVFQLVWNDLTVEINKAPIVFADSQPQMVMLLNNSLFGVNDLSESAYYKKWGLVSPELKQEVEQGIWEKFHEKSLILDQFDWAPAPLKFFLYAMLKKDLEYKEKFEELAADSFEGADGDVEYFGVTNHRSSVLKESVRVLFYNGENDFALTLESKEGDLIRLYKTAEDKTLARLYADMKKKSGKEGDHLQAGDEFKAPKLDFNAQREFEELYNKPMIPSGFEIAKAIEAVQFKMDETGAKLVAEAGMMVAKRAAVMAEPGRRFHFTGPYVMFLEEPGKHPYFAARITDPGALQRK